MTKMRHGLATLNSINSVVSGQKLKVRVTRFLCLNKRNMLKPKLSRFDEIFCFATKPHCQMTSIATPFKECS